MTLLTFTHANLRTPVVVVRENLFAWYYSSAQKCVVLMASGSGLIPVSESVEAVTALYNPSQEETK